ncbi:hypothetical protein SLS62_005437 [Diatrype stigma]|uniref:Uncharacterized protein n=1 Tax=Diatrype stigma TaxID=117547 RepID=A0AAN9URR0_9PEZI
MCGACAGESTSKDELPDPFVNPPKSPYYDAHQRRRPSRPAHIIKESWRLLLVVATIGVASWLTGRRVSWLKADPEQEGDHKLYRQEGERRQIGVPLGLNLTRPAELFWQSYREVLLFDGADVTVSESQSESQSQSPSQKKQYGNSDSNNHNNKGEVQNDWFGDVNVETMLIGEMWSKVEKPVVVKSKDGRRVVEDHSRDDEFHGNKVLRLKAYEKMQLDIAVRAAALRNASREFDRVLGHRARLVQEFMQKGMVWQRRGGQQTVGDTGFTEQQLQQLAKDATAGGGALGHREPVGPGSQGSVFTDGGNGTAPLGLENLATYDSATARSLARTAELLMKELVRQHALLLERLEDGDDGNADGLGAALHRICEVTLPMARRAEGRFLNDLVRASLAAAEHGAAARWRDEKRGGAVHDLEQRICALDAHRAAMRIGVGWLEKRFQIPKKSTQQKLVPAGGGKGGEEEEEEDDWYLRVSETKVRHGHRGRGHVVLHVPELFVWVQGAMELLGAWSTVLMDVEEGVLIALRRKEIAEEKKKMEQEKDEGIDAAQQVDDNGVGTAASSGEFDYEASWQRWKQRNCGATSCYDEATPAARLRHLLGGVMAEKKPLAGEAWDERDRLPDWDVRVWKGIYEKACCQKAALANILKHGEKTPDFPADIRPTRR